MHLNTTSPPFTLISSTQKPRATQSIPKSKPRPNQEKNIFSVMLVLNPDSEPEMGTETLNSVSSQSSMSSDSCSSSSTRISFEIPSNRPSSSPENPSSKPHRSSESAWEAIRSATFKKKNGLNFKDFKLVRQIGSGDIGNVYLCRLNDSGFHYAMKVVDKEVLAMKKKVERAETEKKVLKMLDHPFLPTLYSDFEAPQFSCVVMEFCSGGDLHSLRHKQPGKRFTLSSARFYAAEVLVALEYIHMLGIIYRDLKPENVLVRSDGHIMLSDFDLSLCSNAIPAVEAPNLPSSPISTKKLKRSHSTFTRLYKRLFRTRKPRPPPHQFVAEPVTARSNSFVGTHEYVSPEVAGGKSHGNAVDWWAFGVFLYELIYGRTPFCGASNEETLRNVLKKPLMFPTTEEEIGMGTTEAYARDLIKGLLVKDADKRLGSKRGAADVKTHGFFKGINFALLRSYPPPQTVAGFHRPRSLSSVKGFDFF